jgi:hypothetical protein
MARDPVLCQSRSTYIPILETKIHGGHFRETPRRTKEENGPENEGEENSEAPERNSPGSRDPPLSQAGGEKRQNL